MDLDADLNSDLIFKSDASGSAQLADANGVTITGNTTVERYIPANANRAFRFLASPVTTNGTILENWQDGATTATPNPNSGFGTHITGASGTVGNVDAANGFDETPTGNPSMFTFNNSATFTAPDTQGDVAWSSIANTATLGLNAETPYTIFIRGDRSIDLASTADPLPSNNTTLRATGSLFTSNSTQNLSSESEYFSLVANPYQAVVQFDQLTFTGIVNSNFMYVYDPSAFGYETLDISTDAADMFINPGQSFYVVNQNLTNATSTIEFQQADISTSSSSSITVFSDDLTANVELELYDNGGLKENLRLRFDDNASNTINSFDAPKLAGSNENLASVNSGKLYTIERRTTVQDTDIVSLHLDQYQDTNYEFRISLENWSADIEIYIADSYLNTQTQISPNQPFAFTVDSSIPASVAEDRFSLVFDNTTLGIEDHTFGAGFRVYPNPTSNGQFSIKTPNISGEVNVEITNLLGQQILSQELTVEGGQVNVNAEGLSTGIYVVKLSQGNETFSSKLIVE